MCSSNFDEDKRGCRALVGGSRAVHIPVEGSQVEDSLAAEGKVTVHNVVAGSDLRK